MKAPPATVAKTIHPLCLKKVNFVSLISGKRFQKSPQQVFRPLKLRERNPFVRRVRLRDVAGAEQHAGDATLCKGARVAVKMYHGRFRLFNGVKELRDQRMVEIGLERET